MPSVSIVVPVYGRVDLLRECVAAVEATIGGLDVELVLVDNASPDSAPEYIDGLAGRHTVVRNRVNLGFAGGCNVGAWAASGDLLVFLNSDTVVMDGWLEPLIQRLTDGSSDVVGSRLLFPDGRIQHAGVTLVHRHESEPHLTPVHYPYAVADHPLIDVRRQVSVVTGACLGMGRDSFIDIGGFEVSYWNGYEDVDLCLRVNVLGGRVLYEPDSKVIHHESQSGEERFRALDENVRILQDRWAGRSWPDFFALSASDPNFVAEGGHMHPFCDLLNAGDRIIDRSEVERSMSEITARRQALRAARRAPALVGGRLP